MNAELRELYQEVILDHNRHPRNKGSLEAPYHSAHGHNPLCGDDVEVYLRLEGDVVEAVTFLGSGCAISTASASLMTEALVGKTRDEAEALLKEFQEMVTNTEGEANLNTYENLGDLGVLAGVKDYPVRIKCATLAWHTMAAALRGEEVGVSTE